MLGANTVGATKTFTRSASTKIRVPAKIPVQLIKNFKSLGRKGEIVQVKPAFMRQRLHPYQYALYAYDGPTIPVVEKRVKAPKKTETKKAKKVVETEAEAMSVDELSSFFENMNTQRNKNKGSISMETEEVETISYTTSEIKESIPDSNILPAGKLPISKKYLSEFAFQMSGLEISLDAIRILNKNGDSINSIEEVGEFSWMIRPAEKKEVKLTLIVQ